MGVRAGWLTPCCSVVADVDRDDRLAQTLIWLKSLGPTVKMFSNAGL